MTDTPADRDGTPENALPPASDAAPGPVPDVSTPAGILPSGAVLDDAAADPDARSAVSRRGLITVLPPEENSPQPQRLIVRLRQPDGPVADLPVEFPYRIPGTLSPGEGTPTTFVSSAVTVPTAGEWAVSITVVAGELEQYAGSVTYDVE